MLRGLDDHGCLELLKGLPKELPGVDSHFTFVAVNAGGGGKKERPSLLCRDLSFGDRADDSGLIIEVILRVCGLQQWTEIVTAESCDRPKVSVGEAYTLLPETTHGHRSAPESQTPIDTSGVVSRWKLSGLHEVEEQKQRDVPTHDPHQEVHHTDRKATWVQTSRGSNHVVSWHHLGAEDPAQGGAEQREKPGKSHEDPREMSTKKARRGAQRRVQTIEKNTSVEGPSYWCFRETPQRLEFGSYSETSGESQTSPKGRRTSGRDNERNKDRDLTNFEVSAILLQPSFWNGTLKYGLKS